MKKEILISRKLLLELRDYVIEALNDRKNNNDSKGVIKTMKKDLEEVDNLLSAEL